MKFTGSRPTSLAALAERYPQLSPCLADVDYAYELLKTCFTQGGKLLICGSGGSAADSEHIVGELMKGFLLKRAVPDTLRQELMDNFPNEADYLAQNLQGALPALSLASQTALMTAYANDVAADMVFAQQVYGYGRPKDTLLAISTSGTSEVILNALRVARTLKITTIGLTGASGGAMDLLCNCLIRAPATETLEIQELHLPIYHTLCLQLEQAFFSNPERIRLVKPNL